ncbi:monocarboxylate transporter 9-like [Glandiceps talaboti]
MSEGFGIAIFVSGFGFLTGPPLSGYFFDKTDSYNLSFYFTTGVLICGSLIMAIPQKCFGTSAKNKNKEAHI